MLGVNINLIDKSTIVWADGLYQDLAPMSKQVNLSNGKTLYDIIWQPRLNGYEYAKDITALLQEGYDILKSDKPKYKAFNPENNQGTFTGLCSFISDYKIACLDNADAKIATRISND